MAVNTLLVKNMVCQRCVLAVENLLKSTSIKFTSVRIGEIHLTENIPGDQYNLLRSSLAETGLKLIDNRLGGVIEKVKLLIIKKARNDVSEGERKLKLSAYLSQNLFLEYTYLSSLFSSVEGRTIENYFIQQRIEKVQELLVYNEMTLSDISFEMGYSSVAHLSNQFKQVTGLTPSHFRKVGSL